MKLSSFDSSAPSVSGLTILASLLPMTARAYAFSAGSLAVSSTAKAGLAWPNGPYGDIDQYTTTGKVQWYGCQSPIAITLADA